MLADLHAITVPQNPADLTRNTRETAAAYIACGIDPNKSIIFPQSAVSAHAELAWILSCHTPLGWLNRMTQFKEKAAIGNDEAALKMLTILVADLLKGGNAQIHPDTPPGYAEKKMLPIFMKAFNGIQANKDKAQLGLYSYPVLMAADIIGYHATHVPVGEDQKQHLELARDIAGAFNRACGTEFFPLPEPLIMPTAARIMSLKDGTKKMSKSDPSDLSRITLMDDADAIATKIRKAQTDATPGITYEPETRPAIANLLTIFAALSGGTPQAIAEKYATAQNSTFKNDLAEVAVSALAPITARMRELTRDTAMLDGILERGAEAARAIAKPILADTMRHVGFIQLSDPA